MSSSARWLWICSFTWWSWKTSLCNHCFFEGSPHCVTMPGRKRVSEEEVPWRGVTAGPHVSQEDMCPSVPGRRERGRREDRKERAPSWLAVTLQISLPLTTDNLRVWCFEIHTQTPPVLEYVGLNRVLCVESWVSQRVSGWRSTGFGLGGLCKGSVYAFFVLKGVLLFSYVFSGSFPE